MQNKQVTLLSMVAMVGLLIAMAAVSAAWDPPMPTLQQTNPPEPPPEKTPPATETPPPATAQQPPATPASEGQEKETERFVPTQKTSADNSATFPVDI